MHDNLGLRVWEVCLSGVRLAHFWCRSADGSVDVQEIGLKLTIIRIYASYTVSDEFSAPWGTYDKSSGTRQDTDKLREDVSLCLSMHQLPGLDREETSD